MVEKNSVVRNCRCHDNWAGARCTRSLALEQTMISFAVIIACALLGFGAYRVKGRYKQIRHEAALNERLLEYTQAELERAFTIEPEELKVSWMLR